MMPRLLFTCLAMWLVQLGWGQTYSPDAFSHQPGYILLEPCGGDGFDDYLYRLIDSLYVDYDSIPDLQDPPSAGFYGFANSGYGGCSEAYNPWGDLPMFWEQALAGRLWGVQIVELAIPQFGPSMYLYEPIDFPTDAYPYDFNCITATYVTPVASVGGNGTWRLNQQRLNGCTQTSVSQGWSPPCPNAETPGQFYYPSEDEALAGWYIVQDGHAGGWTQWLVLDTPFNLSGLTWNCLGCSGCTDEAACNYHAYDVSDNSQCDYESCHRGCTDAMACNYDGEALYDNGQCTYPAPGYTCDGTFMANYCGEGTVWDDAVQQCVGITTCTGDLNADDLRNMSDLLLFLSVFGEGCE